MSSQLETDEFGPHEIIFLAEDPNMGTSSDEYIYRSIHSSSCSVMLKSLELQEADLRHTR